MPYVIGYLDGKDIRVEFTKLSGSLYHNYKGVFSIVLLAICDANYYFTLFDLGQYGSKIDCGVLANSRLGQMFKVNEVNELNVPPDEKIKENHEHSLP